MAMPPAATMRRDQAAEARLRLRVERGRRLVEEPDRARRASRASAARRFCPAERPPRADRRGAQIDPLQRASTCGAPHRAAQNRGSGEASARSSARRVAEIMDGGGRRRSLAGSILTARRAGRISPAIRRSSVDLPAPLAPVTASSSPVGDRQRAVRRTPPARRARPRGLSRSGASVSGAGRGSWSEIVAALVVWYRAEIHYKAAALAPSPLTLTRRPSIQARRCRATQQSGVAT